MKARRRSGFTIIELLASMAILMIMVLVLGRVFAAGASAWRMGNKRIESNNSGRTAIEFMARELAGLIVDKDLPTIILESDVDDKLGMLSDRLYFVSLSHVAEHRDITFRDTVQSRYAVMPMPGYTNRLALVRTGIERWGDGLAKFTSYGVSNYVSEYNGLGYAQGDILAENVRNFEVFITPAGKTEPQNDYTLANGSPATIDIYLEVLAEDDAIRADLFASDGTLTADEEAWIDAATRRYATRVYVENRAGYAAQ